MTINKKHGMKYSLGPSEDGIMDNIDMMAHDDPSIRATARLNRDLIAAVENFLSSDSPGCSPVDIMGATMHGVISVCGSILCNIDIKDRQSCADAMRSEMNELFDTMTSIVTAEKE